MTARSRADPPEIEADGRETDASLLLRARTHPASFGLFYERHHPGIARYFLRQTCCASTSLELTAETFAQALASVHRYDPTRGSGSSWLYGIAVHEFHQWLRRGRVASRWRSRLGVLTPEVTAEDLEHVEALVDLDAVRPRIAAALDRLPRRTRLAVELRVMDDRSYPEVAAELGCSEGNARVRVARGLKRLGELLGEP